MVVVSNSNGDFPTFRSNQKGILVEMNHSLKTNHFEHRQSVHCSPKRLLFNYGASSAVNTLEEYVQMETTIKPDGSLSARLDTPFDDAILRVKAAFESEGLVC